MIKNIVYAVIALPLAAFFGFVGYHKACSSMAELALHGAYTAHLPEWIGRAAGWAEIAAALALIAGIMPKWRGGVTTAAVFIVLSQIVSSIIHYQHGEMGPLPQNAVLALAAMALTYLAGFSKPRTAIQATN